MYKVICSDEFGLGFDNKFFERVTVATFKELGLLKDPFEISLILVDKDTIHSYNKEYRNVDSPTDVLSFPMYEPSELGVILKRKKDHPMLKNTLMLGDIIIACDIALEQSKTSAHLDGLLVKSGDAYETELAFLFMHGLLHLLGYDHELGEEEAKEMEDLELKIIEKL